MFANRNSVLFGHSVVGGGVNPSAFGHFLGAASSPRIQYLHFLRTGWTGWNQFGTISAVGG